MSNDLRCWIVFGMLAVCAAIEVYYVVHDGPEHEACKPEQHEIDYYI